MRWPVFEEFWHSGAGLSMIEHGAVDSMKVVRQQGQKALRSRHSPSAQRRLRRVGAATFEYVLVMGAAVPMVAMSYYYSTRIIRAVYQMTCALVSWPFM